MAEDVYVGQSQNPPSGVYSERVEELLRLQPLNPFTKLIFRPLSNKTREASAETMANVLPKDEDSELAVAGAVC